MQAHYGVVVPGVYVTPSFQTATYYPMQPTTARVTVQGYKKKACIPGGTLLAHDGSYPMRCVLQLRGRRDKALWRRKGVQASYLAKDLWLEQVHIYAVKPEYCHNHHLTETVIASSPIS